MPSENHSEISLRHTYDVDETDKINEGKGTFKV